MSSLNIRSRISCSGSFKPSMGARNLVGIGLAYRPASLHRLAEPTGSLASISELLKSLKIPSSWWLRVVIWREHLGYLFHPCMGWLCLGQFIAHRHPPPHPFLQMVHVQIISNNNYFIILLFDYLFPSRCIANIFGREWLQLQCCAARRTVPVFLKWFSILQPLFTSNLR